MYFDWSGMKPVDHCFTCGASDGEPCTGHTKTPEEIAAEMLPDPVFDSLDGLWRSSVEEPGDDGDWIPLEPQSDSQEARGIVEDARGIIVRLVERVRVEQATEIARLREALLWFADEGHYTGTYRHGAGFVDAVGLGVAREALGLPVEREDGSEMPLDEAVDGRVDMEPRRTPAHGLGLYRAWFAAYRMSPCSVDATRARRDVEAWEREFGITFR